MTIHILFSAHLYISAAFMNSSRPLLQLCPTAILNKRPVDCEGTQNYLEWEVCIFHVNQTVDNKVQNVVWNFEFIL